MKKPGLADVFPPLAADWNRLTRESEMIYETQKGKPPMATHNYVLTDPPDEQGARELWLQHGAGFIIFQDIRQYAIDAIPATYSQAQREAAIKGIDDAAYGLMMVLDGVTGGLLNDNYRLSLQTKVQLEKVEGGGLVQELDLFKGDGMCMGYHGWKDDDYGRVRPAVAKDPAKEN